MQTIIHFSTVFLKIKFLFKKFPLRNFCRAPLRRLTMATGRTVAVLAVAAAVCVVFLAQEAASQTGGAVVNQCISRPNCTAILENCPNPCCHGSGQAIAGYPEGHEITNLTEVNAYAVRGGHCVCCDSPKSCLLIVGVAANNETVAGAAEEVCKVYSGDSPKP